MKYFLLLCGFLISSLCTTAQQITMDYSDEMKTDFRFQTHLHTSDAGNHFVLFQKSNFLMSKRTFCLKKYNSRFDEIFSKEYVLRGPRSYGISYFNNRFIWLQGDYVDKKMELFFKIVDLNGRITSERKIAKVEDVRDMRWEISQDSSRLLFFNSKSSFEKEGTYKCYVSVFDKALEKIWDRTVSLPYIPNRVKIRDVKHGKNNSVYIVAQIYNKDSGKTKFFKGNKKHDYKMSVFKISANNTIQEYKMKLNDVFIKDVKLKETDKVHLVCLIGGTRNGPITGVANATIEQDKKTGILLQTRFFNKKELKRLGTDITKKDRKTKRRGLLDGYQISSFFVHPSGAINFSAEYFDTYEKNVSLTSTITTFRDFHILVVGINAQGKTEYLKLIPKLHIEKKDAGASEAIYEENTHFMHTIPFVQNEKVYYIYNDNPSNLKRKVANLDQYRLLTQPKKSVTVISHVNDNNKLVRRRICNSKEINSIISPKLSKQISPNQIFIYTYKPRLLRSTFNYRLGTITIEE